jgi:hypothetical protein
MALDVAPREYRHTTFGIIALSVYIGYLAWRITGDYVTPVKLAADGTVINRLAPFTGAALGIFLMTNVVHPAINHYFPSFWNSALGHIAQILPSDDDEPEQ